MAKKLILYSLFISFCAQGVAQAFSWQDIQTCVRRAASDKSWLWTGVAVGLSLIAGYAIYKKFTSIKPKKTEPEDSSDGGEPIEQAAARIPVLAQASDALCGYHALKNTVLAISIHMQNLSLQTLLSENAFNDEAELSKLVNFKDDILKKRKKEMFKAFMMNQLQAKKFNTKIKINGQELKETDRKYLEDISSGQAEILIEKNKSQKGVYEIASSTIIDLLHQASMHKMKQDKLPNYAISIENFLKENPSIITVPGVKITEDSIERDILKKYSSLNEWLEGDEITLLLNKLTGDDAIKNNISVLDDATQIKFEDNGTLPYAEPIKNKFKQDTAIHAFIVGTMDQNNPNGKGHWYTVVVQKMNGTTQWYWMDSLAYADIANRPGIQTLISAIS
jgi:hypothetical protein